MAYLGRELTSGNYLKLDDLRSQFNGTKKTFNLTSGGQAFYPGSAFSILVSLGGVIQQPESAYIIDRNTITFASAPQSTDDFFCIVLGVALGIGVPGDGTVTYEKLAPSGRGVGIQSGGVVIGAGVTQLNFVGSGNTFSYNSTTNTVDISIQSGVANTIFSSNVVGLSTTRILGINTTTIAGTASSAGAIQAVGNIAITNGALITDQNINASVSIPSGKNGLVIGPVTVAIGITIDVATGSVLVVV